MTDAETTLAAARTAFDTISARAAEARAYDSALAALGRRPQVPPILAEPPAPKTTRPTDEAITAARTMLETARTANALHAKATRDLATTVQADARCAATLATAQREAAHYTLLVDALRKAPTLAAAAKRERLGDMSAFGVQVDVVSLDPGAQGPVCAVTVNGRAWELASRGERVLADAILRAAARRESPVPQLPLCIDDVGAWNGGAGPWPDFAGPVIWSVTDDGIGLTVTAGAPSAISAL